MSDTSLLTPAYKLTIGGNVVDTTDKPQASTVVELRVSLDLDLPADSAVLVLGNVGGFKPTRGDEATIELGYREDGLTQVMTGRVVSIEPSLTERRVTIYSGASALLDTFVEKTYEAKTAGEIVRDLADVAKLEVDTADDGIAFPAYVTDGRRSAYQHMLDLAGLCGFDLSINADGKLVFQQFTGGASVHVLDYAKQVLALEVLHSPALTGHVEAWGESPTDTAGADAWAWLTADFSGSKGAAGSGGALLLLERPALRTADAARTAAEARQALIQARTVRGTVRTTGSPAVKLGDAVQLAGLPDGSLNGAYAIRSVTHHLTKRAGFTTTIGFRAIEKGGSAGG